MKRFLVPLMVSLAMPAVAADRTPWKEPTIGPLARTGTAIDLENLHCTVESPRLMTCLNVGRVCVEKRARDEARETRRFGCALRDSPNYPCPPDDPDELREIAEIGFCRPMRFGGF